MYYTLTFYPTLPRLRCKVFEFLQMLTNGWLKTSFKQECELTPQTPKTIDHLLPLETKNLFCYKLQNLYCLVTQPLYPKHPCGHDFFSKYPNCLFPPLTNAFVIEHVLKNYQWMCP
jgi:hypothetical protein